MADPVIAEVEGLEPETDYERIAYLVACHAFPFDQTRALEFALFRTFAVPSISARLDATREFGDRAQKRYDDTDLILSEFLEHGLDSERGRAAIRRMNRLHGRFEITNEDFLYVLSTFVFEPIRWNARFGWRPMTTKEKLGQFHFWRAVGGHMNIRDIPETYEAFERFNVEYEREHFRYADTNQRVGGATRDMLAAWFLPRPLRPLAYPAMHALMDEPLLDAMGFPRPSPALRRLVEGGLRARARFIALLPPRRKPRIRTQMRHRTYPHGYEIETLGPPTG